MLFLTTDQLKTTELPVDGYELRIDRLAHLDPEAIAPFLREAGKPVMLSCQGMAEETIEPLFQLKPSYFSLDDSLSPSFLHRMIKSHPETKCILAHHNFTQTPEDLNAILARLKPFSPYGIKIATYAHSSLDALRLLLWKKQHPEVSVIPMGEKGSFGRVLSPIVGNAINFAYEGEAMAPGQMSASELLHIYHYKRLNRDTSLYGLIGSPVAKSQGHLYHNVWEKNSVYVKMEVGEEELSTFLEYAKKLGFKGLSVTMPLKEKVVGFVKEKEAIGAINTLVWDGGEFIGENTDGKGALEALCKRGSVAGKTVALLGAGGTARAIAFEAKRQGARVVVFNRSQAKEERLCKDFGCEKGHTLGECEIVINCTPVSPSLEGVRPGTLVMDVNYTARDSRIVSADVGQPPLLSPPASPNFLSLAARGPRRTLRLLGWDSAPAPFGPVRFAHLLRDKNVHWTFLSIPQPDSKIGALLLTAKVHRDLLVCPQWHIPILESLPVYVPRITAFLEEALARKCLIVDGEEMFQHQAALQRALWQL